MTRKQRRRKCSHDWFKVDDEYDLTEPCEWHCGKCGKITFNSKEVYDR
jgi:hypothetical protein